MILQLKKKRKQFMQTKIKKTFFHHQMLDYKCVKLRVSEAKPSDVSLRHLTQASSPPE